MSSIHDGEETTEGMMVHFLVTDGYGKYTTTSEDDEADSFWVLTKEVRGVHNVRENCANALEYANKV